MWNCSRLPTIDLAICGVGASAGGFLRHTTSKTFYKLSLLPLVNRLQILWGDSLFGPKQLCRSALRYFSALVSLRKLEVDGYQTSSFMPRIRRYFDASSLFFDSPPSESRQALPGRSCTSSDASRSFKPPSSSLSTCVCFYYTPFSSVVRGFALHVMGWESTTDPNLVSPEGNVREGDGCYFRWTPLPLHGSLRSLGCTAPSECMHDRP